MWRLGEGRAPGGPHIVLVPGADAPILPVELPDKLSGAAREGVAARQLAEQLSLTPAGFEMHAVQPKGKTAWSKAVVVATDRAAEWRKGLKRGCIGIVPDYFGLPAAEGLWAIAVEGDRVMARLGPMDGFSAELDLATAQLAQAAEPKAVLRLGDKVGDLDDMLAALDVDIVTDVNQLKKLKLAPMKWADAVGGINLKAPPSAAIDRIRTTLKRWRTGVLAAMVALAAWLGTIWVETQDAEARAEQDRDRIMGLVREHFVPEGPILDVRAQVGGAVEAALVPDVVELQTISALDQFQVAAEILARDDATVISANYRAETGLETDISATDFNVLDEIIIALQDAEFLVEQIDSRAQQTGGVFAKLRLELF